MWIASKRMKILRGKTTVWVDPGDPVPEAETWPNRNAWERQGFIRKIRRGEVVAAPVSGTVAETRQRALELLNARPRAPEPEPYVDTDVDIDTDADVGIAPDADEDTEAEAPLKGPGTCPYCDREFLQIERHKCKRAPMRG